MIITYTAVIFIYNNYNLLIKLNKTVNHITGSLCKIFITKATITIKCVKFNVETVLLWTLILMYTFIPNQCTYL